MATKKKVKKTKSKSSMARKAVKKVQTQVRRTAKKVVKRAVKQAVSAANKALRPAGYKIVPMAGKKLVGEISHFFDKISVGVVEVKDAIRAGDKISIEGPQTNFTQTVASMQIEHDKIDTAKKGQSVGMKMAQPVRRKDLVYRLTT